MNWLNKTHKPTAREKRITILILLGAGIFAAGIISIGFTENTLEIRDNELHISGFYGETIPLENIDTLYLADSGSGAKRRVNGYALGFRKKGYFKKASGERIKLLINSRSKPRICIEKISGHKIYYSSRDEENHAVLARLNRDIAKRYDKIKP